MSKKVISIDFDGTIATLSFPECGTLKPQADMYINDLYQRGYVIIINTCRSGKYEGLAEDFLKNHNISYDYINSNSPHLIEEYKQDCRKISADVYIDDKCLMGLPDTWEEIWKLTLEKIEVI